MNIESNPQNTSIHSKDPQNEKKNKDNFHTEGTEDTQRFELSKRPFEEHGLTEEKLQNVLEQGTSQYIQHLLDAACMPVTEKDPVMQESERNAIVFAQIKIEEHLLKNADSVEALFEAIHRKSSKGIRDVEVVKKIYKEVCFDYYRLTDKQLTEEGLSSEEEEMFRQCENVLRQYTKTLERYFEDDDILFDIHNNFLASINLYEFCQDSKYTRPVFYPSNKDITPLSARNRDISAMQRETNMEKVAINFDRDLLIPFEIEQGRMAVFDVGKNVLHVADKEYTKKHLPVVEKLQENIEYSLKGHGDGQRVTAKIPHALHEEVWDLIDAGQQIRAHDDAGDTYSTDEQLRDYLFLMHADMREAVEEHFHFSLKELPMKEQIYFSTFLQSTTFETIYSMKDFIDRHGVNGMRTFLSLEQGEEGLGDEIIEFASRESKLAEKVFSYYGELLDSAEKAEEIIYELTENQETVDTELVEKVRGNILGRAQQDLEKAVQEKDAEKLEQLVSGYVTHAKEYVALMQEVGVGKVEQKGADSLTPNEKDQMRDMLEENYDRIYTDETHTEFKHKVKESLEKSFQNQNTTFNVLRDGEDVICFNRFDTLERDADGNIFAYFGSFNARSEYSGIGQVMLEKSIQNKLQNNVTLFGDCDPTQPISKKYIENGFIATQIHNFAGLPAFEIKQTPETKTSYITKGFSQEEILASLDASENNEFVVRESKENDTYDEFSQGKVLTRFFTHNKKTYLVFEQNKGIRAYTKEGH